MKHRTMLVLMSAMTIALGASVTSAQTSSSSRPSAAAKSFYRLHIPHFGFPLEPDLIRLRPYLTPELNLLLENEVRRMTEWSDKNPDMKPPIMEDLFVCNRYEAPQKFHIVGSKSHGRRAFVTLQFEYLENGRTLDRCEVEATFIRLSGKWLLNNVDWEGSPDLRTLLLRKDYEVIPQ